MSKKSLDNQSVIYFTENSLFYYLTTDLLRYTIYLVILSTFRYKNEYVKEVIVWMVLISN